MLKSRIENKQETIPSGQPQPFENESMSTFSEDEIRTRAYYIYESRDGSFESPIADWNQAEVELMELVDGK